MKKLGIIILMAAALLAGCAEPQTRVAQYDAAEYARYAGAGSAKIYGQVFLKTLGGDVKFGAGNVVWLYPVTSASTEWYQTALVHGKPMKAGDERMMQHSRKTTADGNGNFEFENLPAGDYYIVSAVTWGVATGLEFFPVRETGAAVFDKIRVGDGEAKKVVLTR